VATVALCIWVLVLLHLGAVGLCMSPLVLVTVVLVGSSFFLLVFPRQVLVDAFLSRLEWVQQPAVVLSFWLHLGLVLQVFLD